jgi:terminal uridylyltransferase
MILHYLINIVEPPVLPNLQLYPIPENTPDNEIYYRDGNQLFSMWYFKEVETIPPSKNTSSVGELLRGFFEYYAYKFVWGLAVVSIRTKGGLLTKDEKGWVAATTRPGITSAPEGSGTWEVKDR